MSNCAKVKKVNLSNVTDDTEHRYVQVEFDLSQEPDWKTNYISLICQYGRGHTTGL